MPGLRRAWRDADEPEPTEYLSRWVLVVIVCLCAITAYHNQAWMSDIALWHRAVQRAPTKPRPLINLSRAFEQRGYDDAAFALSVRAIDAATDARRSPYQRAYSRTAALSNLGHLYAKHGDPLRALKVLDLVLSEQPTFAPGLFNKSAVLARLGRCEEALALWADARASDPKISTERPC